LETCVDTSSSDIDSGSFTEPLKLPLVYTEIVSLAAVPVAVMYNLPQKYKLQPNTYVAIIMVPEDFKYVYIWYSTGASSTLQHWYMIKLKLPYMQVKFNSIIHVPSCMHENVIFKRVWDCFVQMDWDSDVIQLSYCKLYSRATYTYIPVIYVYCTGASCCYSQVLHVL